MHPKQAVITQFMSSKSIPHFSIGKTNGNDWVSCHPLSIAGCMIILCECGNGYITINSRTFKISEGSFAFITFDMVAVASDISDDFRAHFISVDFDSTQDISFLINSNRFWEFIYTTPVFNLTDDIYNIALNWFSSLDWIIRFSSVKTAEKIISSEMANLLLIIADQVEARLGVLGKQPHKNRAWSIATDFIGLINRYYTHHHDVAFYADKLNISPNYLNIIVKRNIGTTAKEQINIQLGLVIKMLLDTTDLSVKEIANQLHYDDPSYLCRIFRKQNGLTPLQYRNQLREEA